MTQLSALDETLDRVVPTLDDAPLDWDDILRRSHTDRMRPRRLLVGAVAALAAAAAVLAVTAPGRALVGGAVDWLSAWVGSEPGQPAPSADKSAFSAANADAYSQFPTGTKLGLLLERQAGGATLHLLGLRDGDDLCLRLVRIDAQNERPPTCVPLRELDRKNMRAAIAFSEWGVGLDDATGERGSATFGVADDGIRFIELVDDDGAQHTVPVENNAFLFVRPVPVGDWSAPHWVVQAFAVDSEGAKTELPFYQTTFRAKRPAIDERPALPGPTTVEREPGPGTIGWIDRREPRGTPFAGDRLVHEMGDVELGRAIQPDPRSSYRIGVTLIRVKNGEMTRPGAEGQLWLCMNPLPGLSGGDLSGACGPTALVSRNPLSPDFGLDGQQFATVAGLATDEVARIRIFFHDGGSERVPLHDNGYGIKVPSVDFPAKLVAYDQAGEVIAIRVLPGPMVAARFIPGQADSKRR